MDNSSLTLSRNTLERVDMLMNRDFKAFNNIKSRSLLEKNHKNAIKIFTKKIFFYVILSGLAALVPSIETSVAATEVRVGETRTFIATAYYSPLPNQENYYQGSYEADKKLNGEWIQASDGTPVFVGMIAAPKNYAFGTKIALEGIGVVGVHDRGWSINAWENIDRIDIWMGYGDEWLKRTLAWWRREITGTIVDKKTPVSLDLQNIIKNAPQATQLAVMRLKALGYDTTKSFKEVITDFQMDHAIIPSRDDVAAGAYWPKTTAKLLEVYNNFLKTGNITTKQVINNNISDSSQKMSIQSAEYYAENTRTGFFGQYDSKVLNLQKFLVQMGYNTERQDGVMNLETLHSLRKYQYQKNIGQTGRVDLITQQQIVNDLLK